MDDFTLENNRYTLPIITDIDKLGRNNYWRTYVDATTFQVHTESWLENGKLKEYPPCVVTPKNIGKKNETTVLQQALLECKSKWTKKKQTKNGDILPMLANNYLDRKHYLSYPCAASWKIDGIRMTVSMEEDKVHCRTRTSRFLREFKHLELHRLFEKFPNVILDGELYSLNISFDQLSGCVRSKNPTEKDILVEYWIFDLAIPGTTYAERVCMMREIQKTCLHDPIKFVFHDTVKSPEEIQGYHDQYVSEGFEGLILRNLQGLYLFKNRSNDLLKYKNFEDAEYTITGFKGGKGGDTDAIIFECETTTGELFDVRPRGTIEWRKELFLKGEETLGKSLTVRYQSVNETTGVPRFPVGICIRDYE